MTVNASDVDTSISGVAEQAILWRKETREQLAKVLGVSTKTLGRRIVGDKPWTAREIALMAEHFGLPISTFYQGPDALFSAATTGATGAAVNPRYAGENMEVTTIPDIAA